MDWTIVGHAAREPEIGAYQYSADYSYDVSLRQPSLTGHGKIRFLAVVSHPENVRFVEFYVDNIRVGTAATVPFTLDWDGAKPGCAYHLAARAYSRFASRQPTKSDSISRWSLGESR